MKRFNKYIWLAIISFCFFILLSFISINKNAIPTIDDYPLEVIDNEIRIKETGEVLYRFIPVDGGKMSFEYIDTIAFNGTKTLAHSHCIKDIPSFLIGETPVTYRLWNYVMNDERIISEKDVQNYFIFYKDGISAGGWNQFITKLNDLTGRKFSLPSSFQWEYAARGGIKDNNYCYSGSDDIDEVAFYKNNSMPHMGTRAGKNKKSNELGIYDMSGSVWELTTTNITEVLPYNKIDSGLNIIARMGISRGGDWNSSAKECSVRYMYRGVHFFTGARLILNTSHDSFSFEVPIYPSLPIDISLLDPDVDVPLSGEILMRGFDF